MTGTGATTDAAELEIAAHRWGCKSRGVALLLILVLGWRLGAGVLAEGRQIAREVRLLRQDTGTTEERYARTLGDLYTPYQLVRDHAPERALVVAVGREQKTTQRDLNKLRALLFPRKFVHWKLLKDEGGFEAHADRPAFVVELAPNPNLQISRWCDSIFTLDGHQIGQVRETP